MTNEDLQEFSNIFASEFNSSDIHDRILCFQIIENEEFKSRNGSEDDESQSENETEPFSLDALTPALDRGKDSIRSFGKAF
jgi:hypothetical protein